ncbi:hypothetical protein [Pseudomonas laurentiana]
MNAIKFRCGRRGRSKRLGDVARVVEDERAVQADALRDFDDSLQALMKGRV